MGLSRQQYWSELPCPSPGDLPKPGIEPALPALQMDSLLLSHWRSPNFLLIITNSFYIFRLPSNTIFHTIKHINTLSI